MTYFYNFIYLNIMFDETASHTEASHDSTSSFFPTCFILFDDMQFLNVVLPGVLFLLK